MTERSDIYYLYNCGLMIELNGAKILADALNGVTDAFDCMPKEKAAEIIDGQPPFDDVDYVLFTHKHKDHYNEERLKLFLAAHPEARYIYPEETGGEWIFEDGMKDIRITFFRIPHSGAEYAQVENYSIFLETSDRRIYLSGDCEFRNGIHKELLKGKNVTEAFFNPFFLNNPMGRDNIKGVDADITYIYHIPVLAEDSFFIRRQLMRDIVKFDHELPEVKPLLENCRWLKTPIA